MSAKGHQPVPPARGPHGGGAPLSIPRSSTGGPGVTAYLAAQGDPCQCGGTAGMGNKGGSITDNRSTGLWAVACGVLVAGTVCGQSWERDP